MSRYTFEFAGKTFKLKSCKWTDASTLEIVATPAIKRVRGKITGELTVSQDVAELLKRVKVERKRGKIPKRDRALSSGALYSFDRR